MPILDSLALIGEKGLLNGETLECMEIPKSWKFIVGCKFFLRTLMRACTDVPSRIT